MAVVFMNSWFLVWGVPLVNAQSAGTDVSDISFTATALAQGLLGFPSVMLAGRTAERGFQNKSHWERHLEVNRKTHRENESENKWPVCHYLT